MNDPIARLRSKLLTRILDIVGTSDEFDRYRSPLGDEGIFGPDSAAWVVHRDLPAMLIGGIGALMLQTLHPLAMTGIAEHSRFREDPLGRLHRTARYIAGTTFGPRDFAEQLINEVKLVHRRVTGVASDGRGYAASDPDLLTWVHTSEVALFLRSYLRYGPTRLQASDIDRYFDEVATLAERLGAGSVPKSTAAVDEYFRAVASELHPIPEAFEAVAFLRTPVSKHLTERVAHHIVTVAAIDLLPREARDLLHLRRIPILSAIFARIGGKVLAAMMHWAVGPSRIAALATERVKAA